MLRAQAYLRLGNFYDKAKIEQKLLQDLKLSGSEALDKALAAYNSALAEEPDDMLVAPKARLGIAGVQEDRGDWEKAVEQYKLLTDPAGKYASNPYIRVAQEKLKNIDARRSAPRLADMIPPPAPVRPALPDLTGLPGMSPVGPNVGAATRPIGGPLDSILNTPLTTPPATNPSNASPLTSPGLSISQYPSPGPAPTAPATSQP
jgi:tetratricopeptide (TPR) repeat protein